MLFSWKIVRLGVSGAGALVTGFILPPNPCAADEAASPPGLTKGSAPSWVEPLHWDIPESAPDNVSAQVLVSDGQAKLFPNGGDFYDHLVIRLLTTDALASHAQQTCEVSPEFETVSWNTLKVYRDGKGSDRLATTTFRPLQREPGLEEQMLTGTVTYAAVLDDIRVGDIIETAYTKHFSNPLFDGHSGGRYSLGAAVPVVRERFAIHVPSSMTGVRYSLELPPGTQDLPEQLFQPSRVTDGFKQISSEDEQIYTWEGANLPPIEFDAAIAPICAPYWPQFRVTTFTTWADVVTWAQRLFVIPEKLPEALNTHIVEWRKLPSEDKKLEAAINWVENDIRYFALDLGVHNLKPRAIAEVCQTRFGDCKDKSVLLVAILRQLGFDAWPALTNTWLRERLHELHPDTRAFNHAVVAMRRNGKLCWIDPTLTQQHATDGNWAFPPHHTALIIRPDELDLTDCGAPPSSTPDTEVDEHITFDPKTGEAHLTTTMTLTGLEADAFRPSLRTVSAAERARSWYNFISMFYPRLEEVKAPTWEDVAGNRIIQHAEYRCPELLTTKDEKTAVNVYGYALRAVLETPHSRHRHWPYPLANDRYIRHRIDVRVPFDISVQQQPEVIKAPGLTYRIERSAADRHLIVQHDLRITDNYVTAQDMTAFADDVEEIMQNLSTSLTGTSKIQPTQPDSTGRP